MFIEAGGFVFVYILTSLDKERARVTFWRRRRARASGDLAASVSCWRLPRLFALASEDFLCSYGKYPFEIPALHILISFVGKSDAETGLGRARTFLFLELSPSFLLA